MDHSNDGICRCAGGAGVRGDVFPLPALWLQDPFRQRDVPAERPADGPLAGGLAAGLGSTLYDALFGGYDLLNCAVTFVTKFLMAWLCAKIAFSGGKRAESHSRNLAACVAGALSYVVLYMLKTLVFQLFVYGYPMETAVVTMGSKLPASLLNAAAAMIAAPVLFTALSPALRRTGQLEKMRA